MFLFSSMQSKYRHQTNCMAITLRISSAAAEALVSYDAHVLVGEVVRNCCVELGIVPDTVDGVTRNVVVTHRRKSSAGDESPLGSNPLASLAAAGVHDGDRLYIRVTSAAS